MSLVSYFKIRDTWFWSTFSVFSLSVLLSIFVAVVYVPRVTEARSTAEVTAERVAETAGDMLVKKMREANSSASISSLGSCSGDMITGKADQGAFEAKFFDASKDPLSCSDKISRILVLEVTGFFEGAKFVLSLRIAPTGSEFRCTGSRPNYSRGYPGDGEGLTGDLAWQHADANTSRKCEFSCLSGHPWDGSTCPGGDSGESGGNGYVTTGSENQVKTGSLGVKGAFKAYSGMDAGGDRISNVADPSNGSDMANKRYVDDAIKKAFGQ